MSVRAKEKENEKRGPKNLLVSKFQLAHAISRFPREHFERRQLYGGISMYQSEYVSCGFREHAFACFLIRKMLPSV